MLRELSRPRAVQWLHRVLNRPLACHRPSLHAQEFGAFGHLVPRRKQQFLHTTIGWRNDLVFHFHGLHDRQRLPLAYRVTGLY